MGAWLRALACPFVPSKSPNYGGVEFDEKRVKDTPRMYGVKA